ncbi:MAG: PfkB family carbohydrate kinase [Pseudomonadota bacterium]
MSLLVVGALHWDVVVRALRLPELDETLPGEGVAYQFGGKGGNQAMAAARAGAKVAFAGRIGSDAAGIAMRDILLAENVDVSQLQQGDGASGMSAAIVTETGEYGAVIVSAENYAFDSDRLQIPPDCRAVLLQNEMSPGVLSGCAKVATEAGAQVIWNAAPAVGVTPGDLAIIDTLIVNRVEAEDILGRQMELDPTAAVAALARLAPQAEIILTLGADGVAFQPPDGTANWQPARPVAVISTHGAGDVFVGTFSAKRLDGRSLEDAVSAGQESAATHISQSR